MRLVKVSPQGQITLPVELRKKIKTSQFSLELTPQGILLKPVQIQVLDMDAVQMMSWSESGFEFWNNPEDDVYEKYYA